jgi:ankyrin repeat protein
MLKLLKTIIVLAAFLSNISIAQNQDDFFKNRSTPTNRESKLKAMEESELKDSKAEEQKKLVPDFNKESKEKIEQKKITPQKDTKNVEKNIKVDDKLKYFKQDLHDINPGDIYIYNEMNSHLPEFLYRKNYEDLFFENIKLEDIGVQNTILDILNTTEIRNHDGDTPLIYASRLGRISSVRFLLVNKADICARNYAGYTAYQLAKTDEIKNAITTMIWD